MATTTVATTEVRRAALGSERMRMLVVPREHGAWGMLATPLVGAAAVGLLRGGSAMPALVLASLALTLFWMRTPLESWLGNGPMRAVTDAERQLVARAVAGIGALAIALFTLLSLTSGMRELAGLGVIVFAAFGVQAILKAQGRRWRMPAQMIGALGLTATAPAAYFVVTGRMDRTALALWLANWMFAGDQIHFVQLRIHGARLAGWSAKRSHGAAFLVGQAVLLGLVVWACAVGFMPWLMVAAFVPVVIRGTMWFFEKPEPLAVRRLGWTEMAHSLAFTILLVMAFQAGR